MSFAADFAATAHGAPLHPEVAAALVPLDGASPDARAWAARAARFMRAADFRPDDFSLGLAAHFATIATSLPAAWGGMVLPMTNAGRHVRLDDYLAAQRWRPPAPGDRFLDVGCGFPPLTTVETAERFPALEVTGIDPMLGRYLVTDDNANIACIGAAGEVLYFRPEGAVDVDRWQALYGDLEAARARFQALYRVLEPRLPVGDAFAEYADERGRIVRNPLARPEWSRIRCLEAGLGSDAVPTAGLIRCMNVLMYFDAPARAAGLRWIGHHLEDGGIAITGQDAPSYGHHRYLVWQRRGDALVPVEFAMSPDGFRGFLSIDWHALHDDDDEGPLRAAVLAALWSDPAFRSHFDAAFDRALAAHAYHARRPDGLLGGPPSGITAPEIVAIHRAIEAALHAAGCADHAVAVLTTAGRNAWRNEVGHLAVDPLEWNVPAITL